MFNGFQSLALLFVLLSGGSDVPDVAIRNSIIFSDDFSFGSGTRISLADGDYINDIPVQTGDANWYVRGGGAASMVFRSPGKMGVHNNQGNTGVYIPWDFNHVDARFKVVMKTTFVAGNQMLGGGSVNGAYLSFNGDSSSLVRASDDIDQITLRFSPNQVDPANTRLELYCNETETAGLELFLASAAFTNYAFGDTIELTLEWAPDAGAVRAVALNTNTGFSQTLATALDPARFERNRFDLFSIQTTGLETSGTLTDTLFDDFEVRVFDRRSVNVEDYGAVPDDGMDDTAAIQAALDDLEYLFNIGASGTQMAGVCLIFPEGVYDISKRLEFVVDNPPARWGGLMIHGEGRTQSIIRSRNTDSAVPDGAFYFDVDVSTGKTGIQIEDIGLEAAEADAGPAIEVAGRGDFPRIRVALRNVDIGRTASTHCYTYGFKGSDLMRPLFDDIRFEGIQGTSVSGIYIEDSYAHDIKDCVISGADIGIHHHYRGGEGNHINRVDISHVATGIYVEMKPFSGIYMSNSNGKVLNSTISAGECGVRIKYKHAVYISNNTFLSEAGSANYSDVDLVMCRSCFVTGNSFSGTGANRTGVVLRPEVNNIYTGETMVSDNTFGSFDTGVFIAAGVNETLVMNNTFETTQDVADNGDGTLEIAGTPNPFVSPASAKDAEEFEWGFDQGKVFNAREYGAAGDGAADDTAAIQSAVAALKAYLNGGSDRMAALYFPAGVYTLTDRIDIFQNLSDPTWNRLSLYGDGKWSSMILRDPGGVPGVFNVDFRNAPARLNVHNMMLIAGYANAGAAVAVTEPHESGLRSLYMFNVDMKRIYSANNYFTTCLNGTNLEDPYLENLWFSMYKSVNEDEHAAGTAGVYLRGGRGLTVDRVTISDGIEAGFDVQMNGGTMRIKSHTAVQVGRVGCRVDAGGGIVAIEGCHFNCHDINLDIRNAGEASYVNSETLTRDGDTVDVRTNTATIRLTDCDNVEIRNNLFLKSHPYRFNSLRKSIWLDGSSNRHVRIYANRFEEPGKTFIYTEAGSLDTHVIQNRFSQTEVDDLEDHGTGTVFTRAYQLNGVPGRTYLLKSKTSGLYLGVDGTAVDCSQPVVGDDTRWVVGYLPSGEYALESLQSKKLLRRVGSDVDGNGIAISTDTRWMIENLEDGFYSLQNSDGAANYLDYDPVGGVDCGEPAIVDDQQRWKLFMCRDLDTNGVFTAGDAAVVITCDDSYELYVNGSLAATGTPWESARRHIAGLSSGTNVVAVKGTSVTGVAGLLAEIVRINAVSGTDASWKVSTGASAGWQDPGFDDSGWANATEYGAYGSAPWNSDVEGMPCDTPAKWIWSDDNTGDGTVYFRFRIVVP